MSISDQDWTRYREYQKQLGEFAEYSLSDLEGAPATLPPGIQEMERYCNWMEERIRTIQENETMQTRAEQLRRSGKLPIQGPY
jgi:hypothetical protein